MQCPRCGNTVTGEASRCPGCGMDFQTFRALRSVGTDLADVKGDLKVLDDKLQHMLARLANLETQMFGPHPTVSVAPSESPVSMDTGPAPATGETINPPEMKPREAPPVIPAIPAYRPRRPQASSPASEIHFGQKWLLIAGIVTTVLAIGWFLKYSFDRNWITPAGRVGMSYLAGLAFLGAGEWFRRRDYGMFGLYLAGGGIAILYFATFAGFAIYHLLPHVLAFGLMFLATVLAGMLAVYYDSIWLAVLGLIGGFLTPVVLKTGVDRQGALMCYMTLINAGILGIAFFKQWRLLNYLGFAFTWLLFGSWYSAFYAPPKFWITMFFLNDFFLCYACIPFAYFAFKDREQPLIGFGLVMANAFIALGFAFAMIKGYARLEYLSILTVAYAALFLWMANYIQQRHSDQLDAMVLLLATGILFLVLTIPVLFSKHWITVFWALQAVTVLWAALRLQNKWLYTSAALLMAITVIKFFLWDYSQVFAFHADPGTFTLGFTHLGLERFVTIVTLLGSMVQSGRLLAQNPLEDDLIADGMDRRIVWTGFGAALFLALNIETGGWFADYAPNARFAAISVLWALFSIGLMGVGFMRKASFLRQGALILFSITMAKVFLFDMAHVSTPWRIISFLVLGTMLIGASYLYYRFKDRILSGSSEE